MDAFELLIEDLNTHNDWQLVNVGAQTLVNNRNSITIWMDNIPVCDTNIYRPCNMSLNFWQKYRLYKAARAAANRYALHELTDKHSK